MTAMIPDERRKGAEDDFPVLMAGGSPGQGRVAGGQIISERGQTRVRELAPEK